jgi:WhiB family transcriptional regulator, redox-sensing transcriptional regulator
MTTIELPLLHEPLTELADMPPLVVDPWATARCRDGHGTLTHLFFSDELLDIARAKAICSRCPLAAQCLDGAIERLEPWGVWGGELILNGRIVAHKRPRGRPPKHPRPELVVEEVPIPPHLVA